MAATRLKKRSRRGRGSPKEKLASLSPHQDVEHFENFMLFNGIISQVDLSPAEYLESASQSRELLGPMGKTMARIRVLTLRWGYKLPDVADIMANQERNKQFAAFLRRFAQSLRSETKIKDFLRVEFTSFMLAAQRLMERAGDRAKTITDAYSALLTSLIFMFITVLFASVVFSLGSPFEVGVSFLISVAIMGMAMIFLVRNALPPYKLFHDMPSRPADLKRAEKLARLMVPLSFASLLVISLLVSFGFPPFLAYLVILGIGLALLFVSWLARQTQSIVLAINDELPVFLKTLGDSASVLGNLTAGLRQILSSDYGPLTPLVKRLYSRLRMSISPIQAWMMFQAESASHLVKTHVGTLLIAANLGARLDTSAEIVYESAKLKNEARRKRSQLAGYSKGTLIPLQAITVAISTLTTAVLKIFGNFSAVIGGELPFFSSSISEQLLMGVSFAFVSIILISNSLFIHQIESGSIFSLSWAASNMLILTGIVGLAMLTVIDTIFGLFTKLEVIIT